MMLHTTFRQLHKHGACKGSYRHLAKSLGGIQSYGKDASISLLTVLEKNGFEDAVWALCATIEDSDQFSQSLACDFVEHILLGWRYKHPDEDKLRAGLETARRHALGLVSEVELAMARLNLAAVWISSSEEGYDDYISVAAWSACSSGNAAWVVLDTLVFSGILDKLPLEPAWQEERFREALGAERSLRCLRNQK